MKGCALVVLYDLKGVPDGRPVRPAISQIVDVNRHAPSAELEPSPLSGVDEIAPAQIEGSLESWIGGADIADGAVKSQPQIAYIRLEPRG